MGFPSVPKKDLENSLCLHLLLYHPFAFGFGGTIHAFSTLQQIERFRYIISEVAHVIEAHFELDFYIYSEGPQVYL